MDASEVGLQEVTEEPSQFSSQDFQENQHPNSKKNSKKSPLMNQLNEKLKIISNQSKNNSFIDLEHSHEEIKEESSNEILNHLENNEVSSTEKAHNNNKEIEEEKIKFNKTQKAKFMNKLLIPFVSPETSIKDDNMVENRQEYYFSCHERMINDNASKEMHNVSENELHSSQQINNVFSESFLAKVNQRDTESMPEFTRTSLGEEIEYEMYDYKLNESSKMTEVSKECKAQEPNRFVSVQFYTNKKSLVNPKFLNGLNCTPKTELFIQDLNASDQVEAEEIINSLKCCNDKDSEKGVSKHKLITPKNKMKPFCYTTGSSSQATQDTRYERNDLDGMEYTFGRRKPKFGNAQNSRFARVYKIDFPIVCETEAKLNSNDELEEIVGSSKPTNRS